MTPDLFRARLGKMVNHEDRLVLLSREMPWDEIEAYLATFFSRPPKTAYVDLGYRGVNRDNPYLEIVHRGKGRCLTQSQRHALRPLQAIESAIGHLKSDHRLYRFWLKGEIGNALLLAVLFAVGYNLRWLLLAIAVGH